VLYGVCTSVTPMVNRNGVGFAGRGEGRDRCHKEWICQ
jgi:hypothetical protein